MNPVDLPLVAYPQPGVAKLSESQRQGFLSVLAEIESTGFRREALDAKIPALTEQMGLLCETDEDQHKLIDQLDDWVRWHPLCGYQLANLFQAVMRPRGLNFVQACLLFSDAQNYFGEDLALTSIENAWNLLHRYKDTYDNDPDIAQILDRILKAVHFRLHLSYEYYKRLYDNSTYININPLAECLYFEKAWLELREAFPELPFSPGEATPDALQSVVERSVRPEDAYCRVVALRMVGLNRSALADFTAAEAAFGRALIEARQVDLRSEIGHLHRLRGFVLMRLGRLDEAEKEQANALAYEAFPNFSWWQALTYGEIGDIRLRRIKSGFDPAAPPPQAVAAADAYEQSRLAFERHMTACVIPVDRAVKQQLMRSYADNAVQLETLDIFRGVAAIETYGPRYANDLVVEGRVAATLDRTSYSQFRQARSIVHRDLATLKTGAPLEKVLEAYLNDVVKYRQERRSYFQFRNTRVPEIAVPQFGATVVKRMRALRLPDTVLLLVNIERTHLRLVIVDASTGAPVSMCLTDLKDGEWSRIHRTYQSAAAKSVEIAAARGDPAPSMKAALDALIAAYETIFGRVLGPLLPALEKKQVKIFPRVEMNRVPLHALSFAGRRLIDVCNVSYAPSLSMFLELRQAPPPSRAGPLTVIRDANRTKSYEGVLAALKALPMQAPDALNYLADATWDEVKSSLQQNAPTDILLACHGNFIADDPMASNLFLTRTNIATFETMFSDLDLRGCRSVFLGACESGVDRTLVAAECVGLPMAFMAAGVRYVIGTLWQVDQLATAILVASHYELLLKDRRTVVNSLNEAARRLKSMSQADVLAWVKQRTPALLPEVAAGLPRLGDPPFSHPYYWSGFYVSGDA